MNPHGQTPSGSGRAVATIDGDRDGGSEPVVDGLMMIDSVRSDRPFRIVICDLLYINLKAIRWAVPLADRGVEQCPAMSSKDHNTTSLRGALMQHHC